MTRLTHTYKSEADLCRDFIEWAEPQGWKSYAETAGFDILLVGPEGRQFGIQAKLRFSATLLRQALPGLWYADEGPDHRGVLLPKRIPDVHDVCRAIGLAHFVPDPYGRKGFIPALNKCDDWNGGSVVDWCPASRCEVPEYVPDVVAGASAPVQLTAWKIAALRITAHLEVTGSITSKQIREFGVDARRWINPTHGLLSPVADKPGTYIKSDRLKFHQQHPKVYAEILDEARKSHEAADESEAA